MPPAERFVIYSLAVTTGFRVTELARLVPADFALDDEPPTVSLAGKFTKNGRDARLPLSPGVVALLRPILAGRRGPGPVWPGKWQNRAARMIRVDMKAAGIPERTPAGVATFHSLRHTFVTLVGRTAPLKVLQELARHSTPILTVGRYSHTEMTEKAVAVAAIPMTGESVTALTRPQLEALAALAFALLDALLVTPRVTPGRDSEGDSPIPPETDGGKQAKRRKKGKD